MTRIPDPFEHELETFRKIIDDLDEAERQLAVTAAPLFAIAEAPSQRHERMVTTTSLLALVGTLAGGLPGIFAPPRARHHPRGTFSNGDFHPNMCSCSPCAKWRRSRRSPSNPSGR